MFHYLINLYESTIIAWFVIRYFSIGNTASISKVLVLSLSLFLEINILNAYLAYEGFLTLIGVSTVMIFLYKLTSGMFAEQLFISVWVFCLISVINNITLISASMIYRISFIGLARTVSNYPELIVISKILFTIAMLLFLHFKKRQLFLLSRIQWQNLVISAILSFAIVTILENALYLGKFGNQEILMSLLMLVMLNVMLMVFLIRTSRESEENLGYYLQLQAISQQEANAAYMENLIEQTRKLKHDLKHVLGFSLSLLKEGQYQQAQTLIGDYVDSVDQITPLIKTDNQLLDYILNEKQFEAQSRGITVQMNILCFDFGGINDMHLCIVLGNLLDNALENCSNVEKYIDLELTKVNNYLRIIIRNSVDMAVLSNNPLLQSTKRGVGHGYGIKSVQAIVDLYQGTLMFEEKDNDFIAIVLLNCLTTYNQ